MMPTQAVAPAVLSAQPGRLTMQRKARMRTLVGELSLREMDYAAVAALLDCSCSAARSYMNELRERGLASLVRRGGAYRITADRQAIAAFISAQGPDHLALLQPSRGPTTLQDGRRFHLLSDQGKVKVPPASAPARRDPLVSALFGK